MAKLQQSGDEQHKRNKAEAKPNAVSREWEDIFQAIGHPSLILGPDHRIIACNKAAVKVTGKSTEQLIGKKCCDVFHKKNEPPNTCPMEKLLKSGRFETVEMEMEALDRIFMVSCTPVFDKSGALVRIIHIATDITERKRAEEKLRESELAFRTLFEAGAEGILVADLKNRKFKYANPAICRMLGYTEAELTTMGVDNIHPIESLEYVIEQFELQARGDKVLSEDIPCQRKDGTIFYAHIARAKAIIDGNEYNIGFFTDVTNIRNIQEKLRDNQKRLKALALELSFAEERERRRIAMGIHDDLGQKLAMVKFRLQAMKASVSDRNMLAALNNECIVMDDILDDIHSLTFELSNPLLYEVGFEAAMKSWLKYEIEKNAGLKCEFASDSKKTELDEDTKVVLFKAVRELLINIVRHARAKTVKLGIVKQNNEVEVTVEDDGVGFDVSKLGLPSGKKGGFGLFNIRERLEYIGGQLEIESSPAKGTRVVMTAPVKKSEQEREEVKLHESADSR
ncbi:MAG: PAS domain S-box protein [Sedimentisphaerales bacterium]|jgi:PAS domain S-box-containing protein